MDLKQAIVVIDEEITLIEYGIPVEHSATDFKNALEVLYALGQKQLAFEAGADDRRNDAINKSATIFWEINTKMKFYSKEQKMKKISEELETFAEKIEAIYSGQ